MVQVLPPYGYVDALDYKTSYTMQFIFNVERQVAGNWTINARYPGNESHHLEGFQDVN